jgi:hypothetical protein
MPAPESFWCALEKSHSEELLLPAKPAKTAEIAWHPSWSVKEP